MNLLLVSIELNGKSSVAASCLMGAAASRDEADDDNNDNVEWSTRLESSDEVKIVLLNSAAAITDTASAALSMGALPLS